MFDFYFFFCPQECENRAKSVSMTKWQNGKRKTPFCQVEAEGEIHNNYWNAIIELNRLPLQLYNYTTSISLEKIAS